MLPPIHVQNKHLQFLSYCSKTNYGKYIHNFVLVSYRQREKKTQKGENKSLQQPLAPLWAVPIQYTLSGPISFRSILTISSHLSLGLPSGLFLYVLPSKPLIRFLLFHTCYMPPPHSSSLISRMICGTEFYVLLTVHLGIILGNNQSEAQFFFMYVYLYSLRVSGSHVRIIRRINCINTTSGICHSV
jgi:hypothetical protein